MTKEKFLNKYKDLGYYVLGISQNSKTPLTPHGLYDASLDGSYLTNITCNIAIRTGTCSGIVVLDIDSKGGGLETFENLPSEGLETFCVKTPSGGYHFYFKSPSEPLKNRIGLYPGIDFKAENGYVVAPPSEINGQAYEIIHDSPILEMPGWLVAKLNEKTVSIIEQVNKDGEIPEGQRTKYLVALGGALRRKGLTQTAIHAALSEMNQEKCTPSLPDWELNNIVTSLSKYPSEEEFKPGSSSLVIKASDLIGETVNYLLNKDLVKGEPTGIDSLDKLLGGGKRLGEITAYQAVAKTGKNAVLHKMIHMWLQKGIPIGFASRELSPETEVIPNLLSLELQKNAWLEKPNPDLYKQILEKWPLYFSKGFGYFPLDQIIAWIDDLIARGVQYFFIDHLHQLLEEPEEHREASKLIKELKTIAIKKNIHIDIVIQPNKLYEGQALSLNSLKGGSAISQAINTLILMRRLPKREAENILEITLDIGRSRLCKQGKFYLEYNPVTTDFIEVEYQKVMPEELGPTYNNTELKIL